VAEVERLMIEHSIPAGRVYTPADMLADPHFLAREAIVDVPHPQWAKLKMQNAFPRLSKTPGGIRSVAPETVGQDNAEIYGSMLGLDKIWRDELAARGVI
jgi:crotonobetainyl-CoA:carnitine CoA-transferase CaiB-like acyl-CoA transferase